LPFLEQQALWDQIVDPTSRDKSLQHYAAMGPAPWTNSFTPWGTEIPILRCPSDPGRGLPAMGRTNYVGCIGDATHCLETGADRWNADLSEWVNDRTDELKASGRGMFVPRQTLQFRDVLDGLANTLMAGEIATDLGDSDSRTAGSMDNPWELIHDTPTLCVDQKDSQRPSFWSGVGSESGPSNIGAAEQKRGFRWADGAALYTSFNAILPPNRETCLAGDDSGIGMLTVSSRHQGGAHVLMGDGAVKFITDSIEAGDSSTGTVMLDGEGARAPDSISPYGLWGALGTRASRETIQEEL